MMKGIFITVMMVVLPVMSFASGDSGWAERGNGNEFLPPECHQGIVDPRQPIRPVTDTDVIGASNNIPVDLNCVTNENQIGHGQPKINN